MMISTESTFDGKLEAPQYRSFKNSAQTSQDEIEIEKE
jgi:hypothetical protein